MVADEFRSRIAAHVSSGAIVSVVPDVYSGFHVRVVDDSFVGLAFDARRSQLGDVISDDSLASIELLTHAEYGLREVVAEASAEAPSTSHVAQMPLGWPSALLAGESAPAPAGSINSMSRALGTLEPPVVTTFYSLRGGVGRSTALAHSARLLAGQGFNVLCIDMDLEAPGLASLLNVDHMIEENLGTVALLVQAEISGSIDDLARHAIEIPADSGSIRVIPAGRTNANYARRLALIDPAAWYREEINPLRLMIDALHTLTPIPDIVLIDSRTGISPIAAPLLFDVSDLAIVVMFPHPQAREGTGSLVRALTHASTRRRSPTNRAAPELRFIASPIPAAPEVHDSYVERTIDWVSDWLSVSNDGSDGIDIGEYVHVVPYSEAAASADSVDADQGRSSTYGPVADWIAGLVTPESAALASLENESTPSKVRVLQSLRFIGDTAESQSAEDLRRTFLSTDAVEKALDDRYPLVVGRKGTGKTAIFRTLAARDGSVVVTSPPGTDSYAPWMPTPEVYQAIDSELADRSLTWRHAWIVMISLAVAIRYPLLREHSVLEGCRLAATSDEAAYRGSDFLADVVALLTRPSSSLTLIEWLEDVSETDARGALILFDALDTGFGSASPDRTRRLQSVSGLVGVVSDLAPRLSNLDFKLLLREDIWRDVSVANKSHIPTARLSWSKQIDYLRVALKQAWLSEEFQAVVSARLTRVGFDPRSTAVDYWPESFVRDAWITLAGERISGGRTAFTDNWVWARLADANGDHSPRTLIQLLGAAVSREQGYEVGNAYSRSILRPRALVESLDDVSELALDALRNDEFPELGELLDKFKEIGITPFEPNLIPESLAELRVLASEVGLLDVGAGGAADRYRVPELYRKALSMNRRGQA